MSIRLNGSTSGYVELDAPATAGSNTLVLPDGNGSNGQVLSTDGSGVLSWMTTAGPAFGAYASTVTNTANATMTKVILAAEEFDTANCFSASTFTPNVAGYYQLNGAVIGGFNTILVSIFKNGSEIKRGNQSTGTTMTQITVSSLVYLNGTTDYVELYWYQASGVTQNSGSGQTGVWFNGFLARPV